ncbi:NAD(+) diphosphatase [Microbacteriaceae bacterium VKM Ac-2854]|nr:NAD(+) diphosphatase [Microbacteriaceae bacterium VKM Ac-2854]
MSQSFVNRLPLARQAVDRDYLSRSRPALYDELLADPATRILPLWKGKALVAGHALRLLRAEEVTSATVRVYLGRTTAEAEGEPIGTPVIAVVLTDAAAGELAPEEESWGNLRSLAEHMSERDTGLFTEALAIANWHESHGFSPRNGEPTVVEEAGWVRRSFADDSQVFPRTDAAIIVCVIDDQDRLLLGSNAMWGTGRFSLLAGFVEPGESLEAAVIREIFEESGMRVVDPEYLGSQPWPFPASLMVGFRARLAPDQEPAALRPDGAEIVELRWFTREQLRDAANTVLLPGRSSIARAMIEDWYGGELGTDAATGRPAAQ